MSYTPITYKRAHEFEYVGQSQRMAEQPEEMMKALESGDLHAALEHAVDIQNIGARGYIGMPVFDAAVWVNVFIKQRLMDRQFVKCSCGWPRDGDFVHGDEKCFFCVECGEALKFEWTETIEAEIRLRRLCFTCNHWQGHIEKPGGIIVKGTHYRCGEETKRDPWNRAFRGFGGSTFYIQMNNGTLLKSTNLWCQGNIPEHFKTRLPDNARFLTEAEWKTAKDKENEQASTQPDS
jgi:hypothetical protein